MDALKRYRRRTEGAFTPKSPFIDSALNKIIVQKFVGGETVGDQLESVLIFKDKEGPDNGILYTYANDGLKVGDTIVKKGSREENDSYFVLVEEVKRVDTSVEIRVYNVLEANVGIKGGQHSRPAYLLSNLRNQIRTPGREGNEYESKASVLVAPKSYKLKLDDILNIENLITKEESAISWQVYGIDDVSSPLIAYHHMTQVLRKENETPPEQLPSTEKVVKQGAVIELSTEDGYISTNPAAKVISRTLLKVKVQVPIMTGVLEIKTKINGEIITTAMEVRE